jgi:hypothetical protein
MRRLILDCLIRGLLIWSTDIPDRMRLRGITGGSGWLLLFPARIESCI